jgi:hypothetical protein
VNHNVFAVLRISIQFESLFQLRDCLVVSAGENQPSTVCASDEAALPLSLTNGKMAIDAIAFVPAERATKYQTPKPAMTKSRISAPATKSGRGY